MSVNILVMSDTHGNTQAVKYLLENYQGIVSDVVHLGDYARDIAHIARTGKDSPLYHIVSGNTDPLVESYEERVIEIAGKRIFITHGHRYDVKSKLDNLIYKASELQVDICLFGHTHTAVMFNHNGILYLNPGSPTYPRTDMDRGYGLVSISDEGTVAGKLLSYKEAVTCH